MGGGGSQTIEQRFNMSAINKSIYKQINETQALASASQATVQDLRIEFRDISGCSIDANQTIKANAVSSSELTEEVATEIKNAITNEMTASVQAQIEKATEMGNFQFGDKQNVSQEVTMEIENIVDNTIVTETINESVADQVNIQGGKIIFRDCKDSDLNFDQNVVAEIIAKTITSKLTSSIAQSQVLNDLGAAADAAQKSENKGLTDLVKGFFEGFYGPAKYAIVASVICCCLLILVMIVLGLSPAGQSATANLGKGAAARFGKAKKF